MARNKREIKRMKRKGKERQKEKTRKKMLMSQLTKEIEFGDIDEMVRPGGIEQEKGEIGQDDIYQVFFADVAEAVKLSDSMRYCFIVFPHNNILYFLFWCWKTTVFN